MRDAARALLERSFARLAARRTLLATGIAAFIVILLTAVVLAAIVQDLKGLERAATLRARGWGEASGFFELFMFIIAAMLGCGQISGDVREGTLFGYLARPVSRRMIFVAGWSASALLVIGLETIRSLAVLGVYLAVGGSLDAPYLLGNLCLMLDHLLLLALFAALGAGLPAAMACVLGIVIVLLADITYAPFITGGWRLGMQIFTAPLPRWDPAGVVQGALQGQAAPIGALLELSLYRGAWIALLLIMGSWLLTRRDLAPRI